jgi:hypothetical protein
MVAMVVQAVTTLVILVVMAPWAGTVAVVSLPLVRSCGGDGGVDVQEPCMNELCSR